MNKLTETFNSISVRRGDLFEIELHAQSGAGYDWDVAVTAGRATLLASDFLPAHEIHDPEEVGGGPRKRFLFKADESGTIEIRAQHKRPWEDRPIMTKIFRIKVD